MKIRVFLTLLEDQNNSNWLETWWACCNWAENSKNVRFTSWGCPKKKRSTKGATLLALKISIKPKFVKIRDYWDEKITKEIFDLSQEYEDLFQTSVAELKGIKGNLGEMKIVLKPGVWLVRHRPYRLNPRVKEKVKREIDKMLDAGIIFLVDEANSIIPIVI